MNVPVLPALSFWVAAVLLHVCLMQALDDFWNSQEWITFTKCTQKTSRDSGPDRQTRLMNALPIRKKR